MDQRDPKPAQLPKKDKGLSRRKFIKAGAAAVGAASSADAAAGAGAGDCSALAHPSKSSKGNREDLLMTWETEVVHRTTALLMGHRQSPLRFTSN